MAYNSSALNRLRQRVTRVKTSLGFVTKPSLNIFTPRMGGEGVHKEIITPLCDCY